MADIIEPVIWGQRYEHLTEKDWSIISNKLESISNENRLSDLNDNSKVEYIGLLERIKTISWSDKNKDIVAQFLINLVSKMATKKGFLDGFRPTQDQINQYGMEIEGKLFPNQIIHATLTTHGMITNKFYAKELSDIWNNHSLIDAEFSSDLYTVILETIIFQIRFQECISLLNEWSKNEKKVLTKDQINFITKRLLPLHEIACKKTESEALDIFWEQIKPDPIEKVISLEFCRYLATKISDYKIIRKEINPLDIINKIKETKNDFYKKYVFVQIVLTIKHASESLDGDRDYLELKEIVSVMSKEINSNSQLKNMDNFLDYNKKHIEFLIAEQKKIKEYYEKKRIEEERLRQQSNSHANINYESKITRPEDRGDDFSLLDNVENFKRLTTSADKFARWKAAKVLGTRFIDGKFTPTEDEQKKINEYVKYLLTQFKTDNPGDAGDASSQFWRLWGLAIPGLFEGLKSKDRKTWNVALEHLVILRNENVVKKLIDEYDNSKDTEYKKVLLDTIGKMRTMYDNPFSYRKMMSSKKSRELSDKLIVPFLDRISVTEKDSVEDLQNVLKEAKKFIADPPDSRAYLVNPKTGEKKLMIPEPPDDEQLPPPPTNNRVSLKIHFLQKGRRCFATAFTFLVAMEFMIPIIFSNS
ncbi:MAG: hypothetical protein LBP59_10130 [Planctomycetaceae bacterium]|nr:hypothetical protein [Planctomycetaceae bacterium]